MADVYLPLFDEELGVSLDEVAAEVSRRRFNQTPQRKKKKHPGRQSLPADLPRVERIVACSAAEYQRGQPATLFVTVTRREKRACRNCKKGAL